MTTRIMLAAVAAITVAAGGCKSKRDEPADKTASADMPASASVEEEESAGAEEPADGYGEGMDKADDQASGRYAIENKDRGPMKRKQALDAARDSGIIADLEADEAAAPGASETGAQARAWFPETFLFEPLVVTDAGGAASLDVRVPDRLTSWRVLALAHSRGGAQAGATTSFLGTLETYVDPVVPAYLYAGDQVRIPIQLVNTTDAPVTGRLELSAAGGRLTGGAGAVTIPARGSALRYATLTATTPGEIKIRAGLGQADAVVETIPVWPTGRRVDVSRGGTLAAPRTVTMTGPTGAVDGTDRVTLQVFPGALALLRSELASSSSRGGLAHDAFALLLAGRAPALLRALGDEPDADALRTLSIITGQRAVRHSRRLTPASATLLAEAAMAHTGNPVLTAVGERATRYLADNQRPDGTCGGDTGWTLQRMLVATADCARAAAAEPNVVVRAAGAFARHAERIDDPYTAAAVLASGAASDGMKERLRGLVRDAIEQRPDGSRLMVVPDDAVRADGARPSAVEATALAVLALDGDDEAPLADMGAALLAGYSPSYGWGDGRANLVCMRAVLALFKDPIPPNTEVVLSRGGDEIARGSLSRERIREILTLSATGVGVAGDREWTVTATPAVPGLGFSLTVTDWERWPPAAANAGLELAVELPRRITVGATARLAISAVAPANQPLTITLALPAGVQTDTAGLDALVADGTLTRYQRSDGELTLVAPGQPAAKLLNIGLDVVPTLAGNLQSGAASLAAAGGQIYVPPASWKVSAR